MKMSKKWIELVMKIFNDEYSSEKGIEEMGGVFEGNITYLKNANLIYHKPRLTLNLQEKPSYKPIMIPAYEDKATN